MLSHFSQVWLFATPWTIACQTPLSMRFSRKEYWSGLLCLQTSGNPYPTRSADNLKYFSLCSVDLTAEGSFCKRELGLLSVEHSDPRCPQVPPPSGWEGRVESCWVGPGPDNTVTSCVHSFHPQMCWLLTPLLTSCNNHSPRLLTHKKAGTLRYLGWCEY